MNRDEHGRGARLFTTDAGVSLLLLREARHRAAARLFGVAPDQSFLVTAIAIGSIAAAVHQATASVLRRRPSPMADTLVGAGVVNVALHGIAGPRARGTRHLATLMTVAVVAGSVVPALRGVRARVHRFRVALSRRYGARAPAG
jgi:hypothetical protein